MVHDGDQSTASSSQLEALPSYRLGEKLGQGSFGSVYRALNWTTGETCAVKQIGLANIPKAELPDIMSEIDLLKNLHHPNIVQYRGFVKTSSHLYIILELCENGSLHGVLKKFGRFPEQLVGLYILQVLQGLVYLHDQGVIHRDIKGSNILATKEGGIKLADFGVATYAGGPADPAVVGSPYWMAPEVVDQSGATTSSDIWSLGALVVELLTGKPPYHYLDPMPALFRIVNDDDGPAMPDAASAVVRDFLAQCFQKDSNLRCGARKLLKHPWMLAAKRQSEQQLRQREGGANAGGSSNSGIRDYNSADSRPEQPQSTYEDGIKTVKAWNEAIKANETGPTVSPTRVLTALPEKIVTARQQHRRVSVGSLLNQQLMHIAENVVPSVSGLQDSSHARTNMATPRIRSARPVASADNLVVRDDDGGNRNRDSEDITHTRHGGATSNQARLSSTNDLDDDDQRTIKPMKRPTGGLPGQTQGSGLPNMSPIAEDYSDLVIESEDDFQNRVHKLKEAPNSPLQRIRLQPATPKIPGRLNRTLGDLDKVSGSTSRSRTPLAPLQSDAFGQLKPMSSPSGSGMRKSASTPVLLNQLQPSLPRTPSRHQFETYKEDVDERDYSDVFHTLDRTASNDRTHKLELTKQGSGRSWLGDEDSDEEDPFAAVDDAGADDLAIDLETMLARDRMARACASVAEQVAVLDREEVDEFQIREAALELVELLESCPETRAHYVRCHGVLATINLLQTVRSRDVLAILLRIMNIIVTSEPEILEKICLLGGCPVLLSFASTKYSRETRLEAALFIGAMCRTSLLTLQIFISCRGLATLVEMIDENYSERKDLVWMAIDGIARVFEMQSSTPKNDFCRIFSHEGLLEPLSSALLSVAQDDEELAQRARVKIIAVLLTFAQADRRVKEAMATRSIILRLIKSLHLLEPALLAQMLKSIKNLTMLPSALEVLQNANAIEALVGILADQHDGKTGADIQNHVINALFNLCRLSKIRQEETAVAGAIPLLQRVVTSNSPLKQFALPMLCDFAQTSKTCRKLLWKHNCLDFYLRLLRDSFWAVPALEAILSWLHDETARVEDSLLETSALEALLRVFCKTRSAAFDGLLDPFYRLLRASTAVTARLAVQASFCDRIIERIARASKAVARLNLLRIVKISHESFLLPSSPPSRSSFDSSSASSAKRDSFVKAIFPVVCKLAAEDPAILVKELAKELKRDFTSRSALSRPSSSSVGFTRSNSQSGIFGRSDSSHNLSGATASNSSGRNLTRRHSLMARPRHAHRRTESDSALSAYLVPPSTSTLLPPSSPQPPSTPSSSRRLLPEDSASFPPAAPSPYRRRNRASLGPHGPMSNVQDIASRLNALANDNKRAPLVRRSNSIDRSSSTREFRHAAGLP